MVKRYHEIKVKSHMRGYAYIARVSTLTGNLLFIKAGCRKWHNFPAANHHYEIHRWWGTINEHCNQINTNCAAQVTVSAIPDNLRRQIGHREEAVSILRRLENKVIRYGFMVKNRNKRRGKK